ncbi:MAG: hypothetical protein ABW168_07670 [Sedimenticola sp.]
MAQEFEEIRNAKGVLYKLQGKLSSSKNVNVSLVPKSKLLYFHVNDNAKSKSVSISLAEALTFKGLLCTMDSKVNELLKSSTVANRKRKLDEGIAETEAILAQFDEYQAIGSQQQQGQQQTHGTQQSGYMTDAVTSGYQQPVAGAYHWQNTATKPAASGYQQYQPQSYAPQQQPTNAPPPYALAQYEVNSSATNYQQPAMSGYVQYQPQTAQTTTTDYYQQPAASDYPQYLPQSYASQQQSTNAPPKYEAITSTATTDQYTASSYQAPANIKYE